MNPLGHPLGKGPNEEQTDAMVLRAQGGDRAAFQTLLETHGETARRALYKLLGPRVLPELNDLQQDVFMKIVASINSYRGPGTFPNWVVAISVNVARAYLARVQVRSIVGSLNTLPERDVPTVISTDEARADAKDQLTLVDRAMARLSPVHRIALTLKIEGFTVPEIAKQMSAARSTTRLRLYYARKAFRKALDSMGAEPRATLDEEAEES